MKRFIEIGTITSLLMTLVLFQPIYKNGLRIFYDPDEKRWIPGVVHMNYIEIYHSTWIEHLIIQ